MSQAAISEAASKKRGRPRLLEAEYQKNTQQLWGADLTLRTIQSRDYAMRAIQALAGDIDGCRAKYPRLMPKTDVFRWTLLAELGRLNDYKAMREFAGHFNESSLSVKEAIACIRAYRTGKRPDPDATQLAGMLASAVDSYRSTTGCDWELVVEAVEKLLATCQRLADEG